MRVAVLREDNCQPKKCNDECHAFCPPVRNGQECIVMNTKTGKPHISETRDNCPCAPVSPTAAQGLSKPSSFGWPGIKIFPFPNYS